MSNQTAAPAAPNAQITDAAVRAHLESICREAGLDDVMRAVLTVIRDRDEVTDEAFLALTAEDVNGFYEGYIVRAVNTVQNFIEEGPE